MYITSKNSCVKISTTCNLVAIIRISHFNINTQIQVTVHDMKITIHLMYFTDIEQHV